MLLGGAGAALAQSSAVDVDTGALDALGPPPGSTPPQGRVELKKPAPAKRPTTPQKAPSATKPQASAPSAAKPQASAPDAAKPQAATPAVDQPIRPSPPLTAPPLQAMKAPPKPDLPPPVVGANVKPTAPAAAEPRNASAAATGTVESRIVFPTDGTTLPEAAKTELDELAKRLSADGHLYLQIVGYAGNDADSSQARRLSLSRALAARSYLVDRGVEVKQVDVRPLGNHSEVGLPADRVDLVVAQR